MEKIIVRKVKNGEIYYVCTFSQKFAKEFNLENIKIRFNVLGKR